MYPRLNLHISEEILGYSVEIASHPCYIVMQMRKTIREKSYLWYHSWPVIMYGQFPITIIVFFFGIDVNDVNFIVFVVIGGFSGCLVFYYYLFLLSSWEAFTLYPYPVLLQVLTQQAIISMHCAIETSLNNTKWFWFHVDSFACIHLTLGRIGLRCFVRHRIKSGRPKRTKINFQRRQ